MKENVKEFIKGMLIVIGVLAAAVSIAYFGSVAQKSMNESIYNNGVCTKCGGHYEFVSVAKNKHSTYYYYKCDNCGKIIELKH